jgi:hypothetical protein
MLDRAKKETPTAVLPPASPSPKGARGRARHAPGVMNNTEKKYADYLDAQKSADLIRAHWFEGIKLRLADKTFYTPDFFVMMPDGLLECHEVKGFMEEDANVKIKVAAAMYPFRFVVVKVKAKKDGGGWHVREI